MQYISTYTYQIGYKNIYQMTHVILIRYITQLNVMSHVRYQPIKTFYTATSPTPHHFVTIFGTQFGTPNITHS